MCMHDMKNGLYELVDFLKQCFYVQKSKMELFYQQSIPSKMLPYTTESSIKICYMF